MLNGKTIMVVLPAYNASKTIRATGQELPWDIVDEVLVVDDASEDDTAAVARELGLRVVEHPENKGYGANQKTCYREALAFGADIVIMVHPDYQYEPRLVSAMAGMISSGVYDVVLGSRILGGNAIAQGMPAWKYVANRILTLIQNLLLGMKLSEYHTGYRGYSRDVLTGLRWEDNSDNFVFDNQLLTQAILGKYRIGEISVPTRYFEAASSINLRNSVVYGLGVLRTSLLGFFQRIGLHSFKGS